MQEKITSYDTNKHHIYIDVTVTNPKGIVYSVAGILDTGAPRTEFSDHFLVHSGFLETKGEKFSLTPGLQTQKYSKIILPSIIICHHQIDLFEVFLSHFESSWGSLPFIGLDFFVVFESPLIIQTGFC
jgi:hypothetical protein